jgi:hypothetical protein
MFMRFDDGAAGVMGTAHQTGTLAGRSRALTARLPVSEVLRQEEGELAVLYPFDRLSQGALEVGALVAVIVLFAAVLV